jgi:cephalosporin-C deacetylase
MPHYDLPAHELPGYDPRLEPPSDLDGFWEQTLADTWRHELEPVVRRVDTPLVAVESCDASWRGFGGHRIHGWLNLPAAPLRGPLPLPAVIQFQGYNGGRGSCSSMSSGLSDSPRRMRPS